MGIIKLLSAPIRSIVRFPLFQLAIVVAVILFLQSADENSAFGQICAYRGRRPRCPAHGDHVIRSMTTGAAHELDGAVGFIF